MYICMYVYICIYIYVYNMYILYNIHIKTHTYIYIDKYKIHVYVYIYMYIYIHIDMYVFHWPFQDIFLSGMITQKNFRIFWRVSRATISQDFSIFSRLYGLNTRLP